MDKKKTKKSRATKSVKRLPAKAVSAMDAKGVRGGAPIGSHFAKRKVIIQPPPVLFKK